MDVGANHSLYCSPYKESQIPPHSAFQKAHDKIVSLMTQHSENQSQ